MRIFRAAYADGGGSGLSFAIRGVSTARIAAHAAAFVLCARAAHAAQTEPALSAIGILSTFGTRSADGTRKAVGESWLLFAIDDDAFERQAIDAGITATRGDVVFGEGIHAAADGQVANATGTFCVGRAFDTERFAIRLDGGTLHLRSELTIGATIAGCAGARIGCGAGLAAFAVAIFALGTIVVVVAFVARLGGGIARDALGAVFVGPTCATFDAAIEIDAERSVPAARRARRAAQFVRIAGSAKRRVVAIISSEAAVVSGLVHECSIALLAMVQIGKGWVAAQCLKKGGWREKREASVTQFYDGRLIRGPFEVGERADEIRHLERSMFADFQVLNFERIESRLLKRYLLRHAPNGKTHFGGPRENQILGRVCSEERKADRVVRVKPEMNGLVCEIPRDVEVPPQPYTERRGRVIHEEIASARFAGREHGVDEVTVTLLQTRRVVVGQVEQRANDRFIVVVLVEIGIRVRTEIRRVAEDEIGTRTRRKPRPGTKPRALARQRITHPLGDDHGRGHRSS